MSYQIEFKKKMVHLYLEEGRSLKSLSEEYGVSSASICSWAKQIGCNHQNSMILYFDFDKQFAELMKSSEMNKREKISKLGKILAAAYKHNPRVANEMWQTFIKRDKCLESTIFRIYEKITDYLSEEEALHLLCMSKDRFRASFSRQHKLLHIFAKGYIMLDDMEQFNEILDVIKENDNELLNVIFLALYKKKILNYNGAIHVLNTMRRSWNRCVRAYSYIWCKILKIEDGVNINDVIDLSVSCELKHEFKFLLWAFRNEITQDIQKEKFIGYLKKNWNWIYDREWFARHYPYIDFVDKNSKNNAFFLKSTHCTNEEIDSEGRMWTNPRLDKEVDDFFSSLIQDDQFLLQYFCKSMNRLSFKIIQQWILDSKWDMFANYAIGFEKLTECYSRHCPDEDFFNAFNGYISYFNHFNNKSYHIITRDNIANFTESLKRISAKRVVDSIFNSEYYDQLEKTIEIIDKELSNEKLSIEWISNKISFEGNLAEIFLKVTKQQFVKYLEKKRLLKAMELLNYIPEITCAALAKEIGYGAHISSFKSQFEKFTGYTFFQYKKAFGAKVNDEK